MFKIENGIATKANLYIEDHSCLTLDVYINLQDGGQIMFGGWCLGHRNEPKVSKTYTAGAPTNIAGYYIAKVLHTFDVDHLDDINGKPIRVIFEDNHCVGIQNFMDNTNYFLPDENKEKGFKIQNRYRL